MADRPPGGWTRNTVVVSTLSGTVVQARTALFGATGDVPVDEAVRDLGPVFADVLTDGFTGREWLIERIDRFLAERPCGYLWVEGDAGVGKTALAAHLVRERGWVGHFSRLTRGGAAAVGLRNLVGQLARGHDLAPGGLLPERWCTPEGFETLLARLTGQVVLVVDGADEAEPVAGAQPWGLPMDLPPGVFVVGTYRTGSPPPRCAAPTEVLRLRAHDPRNVADVAEHVGRLLGTRPDWVDRCGGVWVYLRYVLAEIRSGGRTDLEELPADLSRYYIQSLERWPDALMPLVSTLAVVEEPLGASTLAALSTVDEAVVRRHCHGTLRPFLGAVDGAERGFLLYHSSLREFLTGVRPGDDQPDQDWKWWDTLRAAAVAAHDRVAEHYLTSFGGLAAGLPALLAEPAVAAVDGGYPLRHLARHLVAAGRDEDLYRLLRAGPSAWFAAHDHAGAIEDFLSDVAVAHDLHARATDRALAAGLPAPTLCDEAYYDLIAASVVSRTNAVSPDLAAALLAAGVWTSARAVAHARRLPTATARAHVLAALATQDPEVLDLALAEVEGIASPYARAEVLLTLVPVRPGLAGRALHAIAEIAGDHHQAGAIADLVPWLAADQLATARSLAEGIANAHARAVALTALGDRAGALAAIRAISGERQRADALAVLAPRLSDAESSDTVAEAITGHHHDSAVATSRFDEGRETVIRQAHEAAVAITDARARAEALTRLAPLLPAAQRKTALVDALAAATAVPPNRRDLPAGLAWPGPTGTHPLGTADWAQALTTTSTRLRARPPRRSAPEPSAEVTTGFVDLATAVAHAGSVTDERARSATLAELVPRLSDVDHLGRALAVIPYGDRDLLCALMLRASEVVADDLAFVGLLRQALRATSRATCAAVLAATLPRLVALAGANAVERIGAALRDVHSWWP